MTEEAKIARREYAREWRKRNREALREYNRRWREDNPDKVAATTARYWQRKAEEMKDA